MTSTKKMRVWLKKEEIDAARLTGAMAVVMDALLATTTLLAIVEAGARRILPAGSLEEARRLADELDSPLLLTGGEEGGVSVDGFDCGPFPDEYPAEKVKGKDVIFLTTNGTRAIHRAKIAEELLIACLRNAPAVARYLQEVEKESVWLICAGSQGRFSLEDTLCAAVILAEMDLTGWDLDDASLVLQQWGVSHRGDIPSLLNKGRVGRWFEQEGLTHVLRYTGEVGASDTLVVLQDGLLAPLQSKVGWREAHGR
ncbi:putative 2-phosphosulfolactate phosphatase [Marinithermofilum abyssi]|uniref:Probable 2-phosphosulfolactate phosphatase n=1 Tax=Marinithermofilum abyssi TaxID=1571185 RepID=A0A8J2YAF1_9BACL|nr:2-phosphosulfolactate phosphatase [Marinithermofilum abyssi]GGE12538.1 putative 2-phosphosulfolactate phosphatase [Marinithermofilum abyssi]